MGLKTLMAASVLAFAVAGVAHADTTISSAANGSSIGSFGWEDTQTYGQTFDAPVTGTLSSFTLYLNGPVGNQLFGGVGVWNCGDAFDYGCGVSSTVYESAPVDADHAGAYTFNPNISVVAGQTYVAYLSVFGQNHDGQTTTSMPLGLGGPDINYFVWNNGTDPHDNSSWNYFFNAGPAQFDATFNGGVPEPATWALMIAGFGSAGAMLRRRRMAAAAA